jgi:hypothetical protein
MKLCLLQEFSPYDCYYVPIWEYVYKHIYVDEITISFLFNFHNSICAADVSQPQQHFQVDRFQLLSFYAMFLYNHLRVNGVFA